MELGSSWASLLTNTGRWVAPQKLLLSNKSKNETGGRTEPKLFPNPPLKQLVSGSLSWQSCTHRKMAGISSRIKLSSHLQNFQKKYLPWIENRYLCEIAILTTFALLINTVVNTYLFLMLTEWPGVDQSFWQFSVQTMPIFQTRFSGFIKPISFLTTQVVGFGDQGDITHCKQN